MQWCERGFVPQVDVSATATDDDVRSMRVAVLARSVQRRADGGEAAQLLHLCAVVDEQLQTLLLVVLCADVQRCTAIDLRCRVYVVEHNAS